MTAILLPLYLTGSGLLVASGIAKLRHPDPATLALGQLGVPGGRHLIRAASLVELAVAALMVAGPGFGAPAACAVYLGFTVLVLVQLRSGSTRSCGCLGSAELPPSRRHAVVNLAVAAVAGWCAFAPPEPLAAFRHPFAGAVVYLAAASTAWAVAAGLELLPAALTSYRRPVA
ncbi:MAG: MauE/DoxX family redox-associated membrane protein [Gaiellaceae bacterium]